MSGSIEHVTQPIRSSGSNRKSQLTMHIVLDRGRPATTKKNGRKNSLEDFLCRIPRHFGPPHLHVSGGFEDRGIIQ